MFPRLRLKNGPAGGVESPKLFDPQHAELPSACSPQLRSAPAYISINEPAGAAACPSQEAPQHATLSSERIAHVCKLPAAIRTKLPAAGVD
jgi:hypothetical protein